MFPLGVMENTDQRVYFKNFKCNLKEALFLSLVATIIKGQCVSTWFNVLLV